MDESVSLRDVAQDEETGVHGGKHRWCLRAGEPGHLTCGICKAHNQPMIDCFDAGYKCFERGMHIGGKVFAKW